MNKIMKYKGYWAKVQYSEEDGCFCGAIEGLKNTLILFEGNTIEELEEDFREAIDVYLDGCEERETEPEKQSIKCPIQKPQLILER